MMDISSAFYSVNCIGDFEELYGKLDEIISKSLKHEYINGKTIIEELKLYKNCSASLEKENTNYKKLNSIQKLIENGTWTDIKTGKTEEMRELLLHDMSQIYGHLAIKNLEDAYIKNNTDDNLSDSIDSNINKNNIGENRK